ncbi:ABC transporter substrate-binding protein [Rhodococcoides yunnanense]|uniref:ABC transporter substrate-binding protein n=1 Tax=Rhodococcoides yunnanense TaxID=278209 RepID=UPI000ABA423C|nr:ABC transporter substrate-binding protein [Rhodococcus yunnanensis]
MSRPRSRRMRLAGATAALLFAGLSTVTACSSDSSDDSNDATSAPTSTLPDNPATGDTVKLGFITVEGGAGVSLPESREAAEATIEYVNNNAGGLAGHKVELVVCKQQEEPTSARNCANQMVEEKVSAVLVPGSGQGATILPIIEGAGIPYVGVNGVSPAELTSPGSFILSAGLPGFFLGTSEYAAKQGWKNVTFIVGDTGGQPAVIQALGAPTFEAAGLNLNVVPLAIGIPDATPQLTAALAGNPDVISVLGDESMCISVLKALQTTSPDTKSFLLSTCLGEGVIDAVGADAVNGNVGVTTVDAFSDNPDSELYRSILATYAPDLSPAGFAASAYQATLGVVRAANGIQGEVNAASIADALRSSKNVELPAGGGISFSCDGSSFPMMPSICTKQSLFGVIEDGVPSNLQLTGAPA